MNKKKYIVQRGGLCGCSWMLRVGFYYDKKLVWALNKQQWIIVIEKVIILHRKAH